MSQADTIMDATQVSAGIILEDTSSLQCMVLTSPAAAPAQTPVGPYMLSIQASTGSL